MYSYISINTLKDSSHGGGEDNNDGDWNHNNAGGGNQINDRGGDNDNDGCNAKCTMWRALGHRAEVVTAMWEVDYNT